MSMLVFADKVLISIIQHQQINHWVFISENVGKPGSGVYQSR